MIILFGNMLFPDHGRLPLRQMPVFMAEDEGLCTDFKFHKHKLILYLAAMRHHRDLLREQGVTVEYCQQTLPQASSTYEDKLWQAVQKYSASELRTYEMEDCGMRDRLQTFCALHRLKLITYDSPMFLTTHGQFQDYRDRYKRLFMGDFYKLQRRRLGILVDPAGAPEGGQWSYDEQNRKPLPKTIEVPQLSRPVHTQHVRDVGALVDAKFPDHPGCSANFWLPVTRQDALAWLDRFLTERFANFGPYEDALSTQEPFLFHSVLSPLLNVGLLVPQEVVAAALAYAAETDVPLNSLEGFVRQIVGWREYIRGAYHAIGSTQRQQNALKHTRQLTADWYDGTTGLVPVDLTIQRVRERGWANHIERLMVMSNAMLLAEAHPHEVFRWFMELFVDSADWVMVPNVYGMGQFADGGQMMTKPYLSGSNYLNKMGNYVKGDWCEVWDGLYWRFIDRKKDMLTRNPRLSMMVKSLDKMNPERRQQIFAKADDFIRSKTAENALT
ncbi:cryptochrome/photolyase family protein [Altericista sp. CCNU0014]|uniref:cryptochrome/photolyase family protein n=1 Tax=Altericista sp. CCNU0014 TaxID=3082949 RepID=UPI00384E3C65